MSTSKSPHEDPIYRHEISNIKNCPRKSCSTSNVKVQGSDHGKPFRSGHVYRNYGIFVSKNA